MLEATILTALGLGVWFWLDSLRARERAVAAARRACESEGLQLLDDTVSCVRLRPGRDPDGRRSFERTYRFEFSDNGDNRRSGSVVLLAGHVESLQLDPYQLP